MNGHYFPQFRAEALCASSDNPDMWFPEEMRNPVEQVKQDQYAREARLTCYACPAFDECKDYAIQFRHLHGIWAGQDMTQRHREQDARSMNPISMRKTIALFFGGVLHV